MRKVTITSCNWVDYVGEEGRIPNAAWVYGTVKPGYERTRDRYGFYPNDRARSYARVRAA
jgi:uncharacterized protein (DUF427 family)